MIKISKKLSHLETCAVSDLIDFQGDLKFLTDENKERLKKSINKNGFFVPFFVWENKGKKLIIDGHQRLAVLKELGYDGEVPFIHITAKTEKDAKEKLLVISSQYGTISDDGFFKFADGLDVSNFNFDLISFDVADDDWGEDFTLNSSDKSDIEQITFKFSSSQAAFIREKIKSVLYLEDFKLLSFDNDNKNGNALYYLLSK